MTPAQMQASIARHSRYLSPAELAPFTPDEVTAAAIDRAIHALKKSGLYDVQRDQWAHRQELNDRGAM
ncbi:hypothetical protein A8M77_20980 [Variovorax sp. JS1663]|nr:hypothetical protein A8M77_20980 [Variovorax sp. JS1663]